MYVHIIIIHTRGITTIEAEEALASSFFTVVLHVCAHEHVKWAWIDKCGVPCLHLTEKNMDLHTHFTCNIVQSEYLQEAYMSCSAVQVLRFSIAITV